MLRQRTTRLTFSKDGDSNTSENPAAADRILQVTVNDGLFQQRGCYDHDPRPSVERCALCQQRHSDHQRGREHRVLHFAGGSARQRYGTEGSPVTITAVAGGVGLATGPTLGAGVITLSDNATAGGSFTYTGSDGTLTDPATVTINRVTTANITGTGANDIIVGNGAVNTITGGGGNDNINAGDGGDAISGGTGNDIILAGTGNDTITWNANATGDTDGFDMVNGEAGGTDTFIVNGRAGETETFRIYARAAALAAGLAVSGADTEIVITRTVGRPRRSSPNSTISRRSPSTRSTPPPTTATI